MPKTRLHTDRLLVILFLIFVGFGWLNIYSTTFTDSFSFSDNYGRHLI